MELCIPLQPLSINAAFQGRRFKTHDCKIFEKCFYYLLPKKEMIMGWVEIWYEYGLLKSNFSRSDVGNLDKLISDLLVKKGYIQDDRKVIALHQIKVQSNKSYVKIRIEPYEKLATTI